MPAEGGAGSMGRHTGRNGSELAMVAWERGGGSRRPCEGRDGAAPLVMQRGAAAAERGGTAGHWEVQQVGRGEGRRGGIRIRFTFLTQESLSLDPQVERGEPPESNQSASTFHPSRYKNILDQLRINPRIQIIRKSS